MNILGLLSEPRSVVQLAEHLEWEQDMVRRVLFGLTLAELVEPQMRSQTRQYVLFEPIAETAQRLRATLAKFSTRFPGKVVRDGLALQLVLKRSQPDALFFAADTEEAQKVVREMFTRSKLPLENVKRVGILNGQVDENSEGFWNQWPEKIGTHLDATLGRPYTAEQLVEVLDQLFAGAEPCTAEKVSDSARHADEPVATGATSC
jgi:hypothetical protein